MQNIIFVYGDTAQNAAYTGTAGTFSVDLQLNRLHFHDGETPGGHTALDYSGVDSIAEQLAELGIEDIAGLSQGLTDLIDSDRIGQANGVVGLNEVGEVPEEQLPQYVVDVVEVADFDSLPVEGISSRFYITVDDNRLFRWTGSAYVEITPIPGDTDELDEGENNLYFTTSRQREALDVTGDLVYDSATGELSLEATVHTPESLGVDQIENLPVATEVQAVAAETNEAYVTPARIRNLMESIGLGQDGDSWFFDEGEMGFSGEMQALDDFTSEFEGELPIPATLVPYGTTAENDGWTLEAGEISIDTDKNKIRLHDGETQGGFELPDIND